MKGENVNTTTSDKTIHAVPSNACLYFIYYYYLYYFITFFSSNYDVQYSGSQRPAVSFGHNEQ